MTGTGFEKIPAGARNILKRLDEAGYEAYIVGGCVRDCLLGQVPADWDITTSARPEEIKQIFHHTVDTGLQHGTVTVLQREDSRTTAYEVTTYRIDGIYEDARHPKEVSFTTELAEDLRRRDFTVNAMAYHPQKGLVDLYHGQEDLKERIIRAVGDPGERFSEDALRMMRAIRFAAQLKGTIESKTWEALCRMHENIRHVSAERIRVEMEKLLLSERPDDFRFFYESGLTEFFLPEWDAMMQTEQETPHHCYNVGEHTLQTIRAMDTEKLKETYPEGEYRTVLKNLRLALLLHDVAKPVCKTMDGDGTAHFKGHPAKGAGMAETILRRLRYDNETIETVVTLIRVHDSRWDPAPESMRRAISRTGEKYFPMIFFLTRADVLGQSMYEREAKLALIDAQEESFRKIRAEGDCTSLKDLAVSGKDLIAAGVRPGPGMGELLNRMLEDVLGTPEHNEKGYLLDTYVMKREGS